MTEPVVGVMGAYGAVGRTVAHRLHENHRRLRLGGRNAESLGRFELGDEVETHVLDLTDAAALARFCAGCAVVINCAGPSHRITDTVARAAVAAGADYVDPGGDERLLAQLSAFAEHGRTAILAAGVLPGLSALLPRFLSRTLDRSRCLTVYHGVRDRFTASAAADFLAGLDADESLASWADGRRRSGGVTRLVDIELPLFSSRVTAHPYLSAEGERIARLLELENGRWYNVFDGRQLLASLDRFAGRAAAGMASNDLDATTRRLMRAAELDVVGLTPHLTLLIQLDGERGGLPATRSLVLRANAAAGLTAATAVSATEAILDGTIGPGAQFAAAALDPELAVDQLRADPAVVRFDVVDEPLAHFEETEEGAL
ncbi:saccharopine dehydrogenase NADP-binding domain-containing protein [Nocardia sp. NPDC050175]|uniref:saccharopine dehydrogenase NADP-binding domain-containing protein n=1 Tax=Nocardia sp. NPDC050175 TaxID=3364317 RepID=UPI0037AC4C4B